MDQLIWAVSSTVIARWGPHAYQGLEDNAGRVGITWRTGGKTGGGWCSSPRLDGTIFIWIWVSVDSARTWGIVWSFSSFAELQVIFIRQKPWHFWMALISLWIGFIKRKRNQEMREEKSRQRGLSKSLKDKCGKIYIELEYLGGKC